MYVSTIINRKMVYMYLWCAVGCIIRYGHPEKRLFLSQPTQSSCASTDTRQITKIHLYMYAIFQGLSKLNK